LKIGHFYIKTSTIVPESYLEKRWSHSSTTTYLTYIIYFLHLLKTLICDPLNLKDVQESLWPREDDFPWNLFSFILLECRQSSNHISSWDSIGKCRFVWKLWIFDEPFLEYEPQLYTDKAYRSWGFEMLSCAKCRSRKLKFFRFQLWPDKEDLNLKE